eukprot:5076731-Amphidinium_carterae.1
MTRRRSTAQKVRAHPSTQHRPHTRPASKHQDSPVSSQLRRASHKSIPEQARCCCRNSSL